MKIDQYIMRNKLPHSKNNVVLITHKNCPDGAAAGVLVKKIYPNAQICHCIHEKVDQESNSFAQQMQDGDRLIIADICPSQDALGEIIKTIQQKNGFLGIYEHHETNSWLEDWQKKYCFEENKTIEIIFDKSRCGSKIFYDCFVDLYKEDLANYEEFIMLTNDRDLWLRKDPRSYRLSLLHKILDDENYVKRFLKNPTFDQEEKENIILDFFIKMQKKNEEKILKKVRVREDKDGYRYGVIYGNGDSSNILNEAIVRLNLEYALLVNLNTKKVSLRGKGTMDCSKYAEKYGGGGHRCASGFRIQFNTPEF